MNLLRASLAFSFITITSLCFGASPALGQDDAGAAAHDHAEHADPPRAQLPPRPKPSMGPRVLFFDETFPFDENDPYAGHWHGNVFNQFGTWSLSIKFYKNDMGDNEALYSLTPGNAPNQITQRIAFTDSAVEFYTSILPTELGSLKFDGTISDDGQWMRGDVVMPDPPIAMEIQAQNYYLKNDDKPPLTEDEERAVYEQFRAGTFELKRVPRTLDLPEEKRIAWAGAIDTMGVPFDLVICIAETPGGNTVGHLDIAQQLVGGWPIDGVERDGTVLRVHLGAGAPGVFNGTISEDGETFSGTLEQQWMTDDRQPTIKKTPFVFKRVPGYTEPAAAKRPVSAATPATPATPVNTRPQNPVKPYPYDEHDVTIEHPDDHSLAGTLTMPRTPGPHPVAILLSDSGAHNRNHEGYAHKPFLVLADFLTRRGIAVLRFDDRGKDKSTGRFSTATVQDLATDAVAVYNFARAVDGVDPDNIGFIGYGEGAWHAVVAAQDVKPAFIAMLAAPGIPGYAYQQEQIRLELERVGDPGDETAGGLLEAQAAFLTALGTGDDETTVDELATKLAQAQSDYKEAHGVKMSMSVEDQSRMILARNRQPWQRSFLTFNPMPGMRELECPVFTAWGELDRTAPPTANRPAIDAVFTGKDGFQSNVYEGLNHFFQPSETGYKNEFSKIPITISDDMMLDLARWIRDVVK